MRRTTFFLLALSLAGAAGAASTPEEAVKAFRRAYETKDPTVRRKAVGLLEEVPGPLATAALLPALADPASPVRERARDVLSARTADADLEVLAATGLRSPEAEVRRRCAEALAAAGARAGPHAGALEAVLKDREPRVREAAALALAAAGGEGPATAVAAACAREAVPAVRAALLLAWAARDPAGAAAEAARTAARERDGPPVLASLRILAKGDPAAAARTARSLLHHPDWTVRIESADLLAALGAEGADVEALIGALRREKRSRVRGEAASALERLTGAPLGEEPGRWESWWAKHREGWKAGRASPAPAACDPGDGASTARFYDIPVETDRMAFVIDTSKSMTDPARLGETATKMQLALAQLARTLAGLREDSSFNVVAFGTEVETWKPRAVPAGASGKYEAMRFLQKKSLEGRTNIFDAVAAALEDPEVDTLFLLTDGAPTAGEETTRTGFMRGLAALRRWRPVRIHCVEVGAQNTGMRWKGFLAEVASSTGGRHVAK
jgi:HEAT repeat protein